MSGCPLLPAPTTPPTVHVSAPAASGAGRTHIIKAVRSFSGPQLELRTTDSALTPPSKHHLGGIPPDSLESRREV